MDLEQARRRTGGIPAVWFARAFHQAPRALQTKGPAACSVPRLCVPVLWWRVAASQACQADSSWCVLCGDEPGTLSHREAHRAYRNQLLPESFAATDLQTSKAFEMWWLMPHPGQWIPAPSDCAREVEEQGLGENRSNFERRLLFRLLPKPPLFVPTLERPAVWPSMRDHVY